MSWVAGAEIHPADFDPLVTHGVNWIVQTPFGWQRDAHSPDLHLVTDGHIYWGERDAGIERTSALAKARGIRTLLKPHIWLTRPAPGEWRSDIAMTSEADWKLWFDNYRAFVLHYASLAERAGIDALCIGTELRGTVAHRPGDWRKLIAEVRAVYAGRLTYAANWYAEFEEVPFWDALDSIGIQAYFPLADGHSPSHEELRRGWQRHVSAIAAVQKRFGKPVLFTEIGYRSAPDGATEPWKWDPRDADASPVDLRLQADAYRAFFETFWHEPWFAGAYIWKWFPGRTDSADASFTPQGKPAEQVMAEWYRRGG